MSANRPFGRRLGPDELSGRTGIVAIADVHGNFEAFDAAIDAALAAGRFVVQLGDLVDRGPYSPLCVERMLDLETEGKGLFVPGNHEVALAQYLADGTGGAVTRQASLLQFEEHGGGLLDRFDVGAVAVHGYGTSAERRSGRMARTWADAIPAGLTVVVGHAVTASRTVETVEGRLGGRAVFADTGSWLDPAMPAGTYDIAFR
jgi:hypothetical protein